jgi:hypothetical protein
VRALWKLSLGISLAWLACRVGAEELQWRPVAASPTAKAAAPAAEFGRPVALKTDPAVRPVGFSTTDDAERPVFRGQMPDFPKPMPPAGGKDKSVDVPPREVRETLAQAHQFPPTPSPVPQNPGDYCVANDAGGPSFCGDGCCPWGGNCGDGHLWWANAEYLLWWTKSGPAPTLVTTGPASTFGVVGADGTQILSGGSLDYGVSSGARFQTGLWFCECQTFGIDVGFFFLGDTVSNFLAVSNSSGSPVLSRPFTGAITGQATVEQVAFPGEQAGSVAVHSTSRLLGADTNLLWNPRYLCWSGPCCGNWRWGFSLGFRYLNLKENLGIAEDFTDLGTVVTRHQLTDSFKTTDNFYGGQLGTNLEWKRGPWTLDVRAKVALGTTNQKASIAGSELDTSLNSGQQVSFNSGLLALPSNIGSFNRNVFSVVPEVGMNLSYQLCPNWRLFVGYNFLYWNNVARPGAVIDTVVNTTQQSGGTLTGPARPAFAFHNTDYWAHGVNFGLELRY